MSDYLESDNFTQPSELKNDIAGRIKTAQHIKGLELTIKGDGMEGGREFGYVLSDLRKKGVRISHEFLIRMEFPQSISRDKALTLVGTLPKSKNGTLKVKIQFSDNGQAGL